MVVVQVILIRWNRMDGKRIPQIACVPFNLGNAPVSVSN